MHTIDWVIIIPLVVLVAAAFVSWRKNKNCGCHNKSCSTCSRNPNTCPYTKEKQNTENPNNEKRPEDL